jgi:hypothetical protein
MSDKVNVKWCSFPGVSQETCAPFRVVNNELVVAVDIVKSITKKPQDQAGYVIRNLKEDLFPPENFVIMSIPGQGNTNTRLVNFRNASLLVMVAPGKVAKTIRASIADIFTRYAAGDLSLIQEIQANARSLDPFAQMARASLASSGNESRIPSARVTGYGYPAIPWISHEQSQLDSTKQMLDQRATELDAWEKKLDDRTAMLDMRHTEAEKLRAKVTNHNEILKSRHDKVLKMHAKNKEHLARNDARSAELDEYQAKLGARDAELDEYQAKLDARAAEMDEYQAKLDARAAEMDAKTIANEEAITAAPVHGVKRPREAEYSFLMQAAEELKKIHASDWDDETKQVFKKRLLDIIQRDD